MAMQQPVAERAYDIEDVDTDGSADHLLQHEEDGERSSSMSFRTAGRATAATLLGAAALACVLGITGADLHARMLHMSRGAMASGISNKESASAYTYASSEITDENMFGQSSSGSTSKPATRYGQQVFDANMNSLSPKENKNDGNVCGDDEEDFENACYKKCSLLTGGKAPHRTSPWSCCPSQGCSLSEEMVHVSMCSGYDVAGDAEGKNKCPHTEGVCLRDEELFLGMCYKQCSLLTNGKYVHRKTALTCCDSKKLLYCINPLHTDTSKDYSVGGGVGDGDASTPKRPHPPMKALAETSEST